MKVARVIVEAPVASFRQPHFLVGRQPSYDMPPPSTLYGHIASATGAMPAPADLRIGYHFTFDARAVDLEHQHIIWRGSPEKLKKGEAAAFKAWRAQHDVNLGGSVQPTLRDFLVGCRLTLYLQPADLADAFRNPVFCVNLGRSQDLAAISNVAVADLLEADAAYLEHTLLPFDWFRSRTHLGATVLMPRYIGPPPERAVEFRRYIALHDRLWVGQPTLGRTLTEQLLNIEGDSPRRWWVDPESPEIDGAKRGVEFLAFV